MHLLDRLIWAAARLLPAVDPAPWQAPLQGGPTPIDGPDPDAGLLPDLAALGVTEADPAVRSFFAHTARFELPVEVAWRGPVPRALAWLWARLFARRWGQLELPTKSGAALTNDVFPDRSGAWWARRYVGTRRALYRARFDVVPVAGERSPRVRVQFPVPGGAWVVLFGARGEGVGGVALVEEGRADGLYLVPRSGCPRFVRVVREAIVVVPADDGVRATHTFVVLGATVLTLTYAVRGAADGCSPSPTAGAARR